MPESVPLHFTLELGVCETKEVEMVEKHTWSSTWDAMENASWSTGFFCQAHLKGMGSTQNWETMPLQNFTTVDWL
jgi:hypothetical protein